MSDPMVMVILRNKASELQAHIAKLERAADQARSDLAHIKASILLFDAPEAGEQYPMHFNLGRLFKGRELGQMCSAALIDGPKDTRQLAEYIIREKGLDASDKHLRISVQLRVVNAMRMREKRGMVARQGKRAQAIVWAKLPQCVV